MINISGFGLRGLLKASNTFPNGIDLTAFADDADSLDSPDLNVAQTSNGLNGHLLVWNQSGALEVGVNVIPGSQDDVNLAALTEANRVGLDKRSVRDVISLVVSYPDGSVTSYSGGTIVVGSPAKSVTSQQRLRTRQYRFRFEKKNTVNEKPQEV